MPQPSRIVLVLLVLLALGVGACATFRSLLPERYAVNAPMLNSMFGWGIDPPDAEVLRQRIQVAPGYGVGIYARVPQARWLEPTAAGDLLVSLPRQGRILLLERDADGDGRADGQRDLLSNLDRPHGMDIHEGWLYVAEASGVFRVRFDEASGQVTGSPERLVEGLPEGGNHWTRSIGIGPDGNMYVSVGSSCNVCLEEDERRAAILRFPATGGKGVIHARGLRNSVGFAWQPSTGDLYATDNGRDLLGDDIPPCELNLVVAGGDYGWPVAHGNRVVDPDVGAGHEARVEASIPPAHAFDAHTAPLGLTFLGEDEPGDYAGAALAALHGSWNRTQKSGYKVVSLHWRASGEIEERDFLWGFLVDEDVIGRPSDVAQGPDGSIYVADDYAGVVYRVARGEASRQIDAGTERTSADPLAELAPEDRAAAAARGTVLYEKFACAGCHEAERAQPGVVPVLLTGLTQRYDLPGLSALFLAPTPPMPVFSLSEAERRDLTVHLLIDFP